MKSISLFILLTACCTVLPVFRSSAQQKSSVTRSGEQWKISMPEALALAKKTNKAILVNFTGSDWCSWCIRLDKEVFSKPAFKKYAAKNLVLLKVDFPRNQLQTPAEKRANADLARRYGVRGYPTILLLDSKGSVITQTGYRKGGASAYVRHLQQLLKNRK